MRRYRCRCGQPIFFRNSQCLACGSALGWDPQRLELVPIEPDAVEGVWRAIDAAAHPGRWYRCAYLGSVSACNWLVEARGDPDDACAGMPRLCRCCRLLRTVPDIASNPQHAQWFGAIELARRQLVARLIALGLPLRSRVDEDPQHGLAFDLLVAPPGGPAVVTGHAEGVITLDIAEADDALRESRRSALGEPYRTLLGHLRHETGHYYWLRLVAPDAALLAAWRDLFGDERAPYAPALQRYYAEGPAPDWSVSGVSAYATAHPWEDWAETWAHYLHFVDTLETARALGLSGDQVALDFEPFEASTLGGDDAGQAAAFAAQLRGWMELAGALNELCRSMGVADFYPFVLSLQAARKLFFVQRLVGRRREAA